jgi:hypothetical protein
MSTLERSLAKLVKQGIVSQVEAERVANDPRVLEDELKRA